MSNKRYNKQEYRKDRPYNKQEKRRIKELETSPKHGRKQLDANLPKTNSRKNDIIKTKGKTNSRSVVKSKAAQSSGKLRQPSRVNVGEIFSNLVWLTIVLVVFWDMPFFVKIIAILFFGGRIAVSIFKR